MTLGCGWVLAGVGETQPKGISQPRKCPLGHGAGSPARPLTGFSCPCLFAEFQVPVTEPDINNRLESLCLSMTEHALSGEHSLLLGLFQHVQAASAEPPGSCPAPPKGWDRLWL